MISASEIHELRFEKAAFGYKQEDIDEFLNKLEEEAAIAQRELDDSNNKIQVQADKVREYMRDEDALKDALLGAQKEGHRIISEANAKAEEIIAQAKEKAAAIKSALTTKVNEGKLVVVEGMEFDAPKTKTITTLLNGLDKKKALIVVAEEGKNAALSVRNIPTARGVFANSINVYDILKYDNVILTKSAVAAIEEVYA